MSLKTDEQIEIGIDAARLTRPDHCRELARLHDGRPREARTGKELVMLIYRGVHEAVPVRKIRGPLFRRFRRARFAFRLAQLEMSIMRDRAHAEIHELNRRALEMPAVQLVVPRIKRLQHLI